MENVNIEKMISFLVANKRNQVLNALIASAINIDTFTTDKNLFNTVMYELNQGNENLFINLGKVVDDNFDLSPLADENSNYSNGMGPDENYKPGGTKVGNFLRDNSDSIFTSGFNLFKGLFGGGGGDSSTATPPIAPSGGGNSNSTLLLMQQQAAAQAARDKAASDQAAASSKKTMIIILSVFGGLLLVAGIVTVVVVAKGKKAAKGN